MTWAPALPFSELAVRVVEPRRSENAAWHRELAAVFALLALVLVAAIVGSTALIAHRHPELSWSSIAMRFTGEYLLIAIALANALREAGIARRMATGA